MTVEEIRGSIKEYCLVLLKKGPEYNNMAAEVERQNQVEHLQYLLQLRDNGLLAIVGPIMDGRHIIGMCVYNTPDKQTVKELADNDPAVIAGRVSYEILTWFGFPGDKLGQLD